MRERLRKPDAVRRQRVQGIILDLYRQTERGDWPNSGQQGPGCTGLGPSMATFPNS